MGSALRLAFVSSVVAPRIKPKHCLALLPSRHPFSTGFLRVPKSPRTKLVCSQAASSSTTVTSNSSLTSADSGKEGKIAGSLDSPSLLTFQDAIQRLCSYWASKGCLVWHPYNVEVGAGTMNPATFLRVLGPEPWSVAYDEPSIRPDDSRYGENPNRLQRHTQFQVILKPAPDCAQELVVGSYKALGIDTCKNDIRFVEDNWESPALGAWGLGWEVWLNGMEVTQFTYFQQAGGLTLDSVAVEITYGLERIIMSLQGKSHFKDIIFAPGITYGDVFMQNEIEMSQYNMDAADVDRNKQMFQIYEEEALSLLEKRLPVPAYNYVLKASHTFNILDARGAIGVTERARYFQRMRALSRDVARLWLARREELEFPLLTNTSEQVPKSDEKRTNSSKSGCDGERADFVLEIGVEELPADDVSEVVTQVEKLFGSLLESARLSCSKIEVDGTPRRIVVSLCELQTRQADVTKRIRGPPLAVAIKEGELTKAATGFMRSQGLSESEVEMDENGGYMYATVKQVGRPATVVLSELLRPEILERINFGKSMRWNDTGVAFSRPVRWLACLIDDVVVDVSFAGVTSSNFTRSLRGENGFACDVEIPSASEYPNIIGDLQIVISRRDRMNHIKTEATRLAGEIGGVIPSEYLNGALVEEVTDLVENPLLLLGRFDERYLELPKEVLETVMKKHQRYLPVVHKDSNELINAFVAVANGDAGKVDMESIRSGNESVLRARYSDAAFFYDKDTKGKTLLDYVPLLSGLSFQESLGSMLDKTNRVCKSAEGLSELFGLSSREAKNAKLIAKLFKADLATSMVIEMTSLAGTIGRHYSIRSGEVPLSVSQGIFEANLPRFSGDIVAASSEGATVAIADRLDSLVGLFSVGLVPKSTADPFALRRAALGVVQTIIAVDFNVDLGRVIGIASSVISDQTGKKVRAEVQESVLEFIAKRLEGYLLDNMNYRDDVVKTVLAVASNRHNPVAAMSLCSTLTGLLENEDVLSLAQEAHCRASRLLGSVKDRSFNELLDRDINSQLFDCNEERQLWDSLIEKLDSQDRNDSAGAILRNKVEVLSNLKPLIDAFFDNVFVNAEDPEVRLNRLALCAKIVSISGGIVDLSLLVML